MKSLWGRVAGLVAAAMVCLPAYADQAPTAPLATNNNAFDRYLAKPDPAYGWKLVNTLQGPGYTAYVLDLTSQTWRTAAEVDRPVWKHWLTIVKPDKVVSDKAFLYIDGGSVNDKAPAKAADRVSRIATETNSVAIELRGVPNEPLHFTDNPAKAHSEDDLIAYAQTRQMASGDETWMLRLAMVKSAQAAMTASQEFLKSDEGGKLKIKGFVVAGGSKRGWTAWLTGIEDKRVIAMMPLSIDMLNNEAMIRHHYEALGFFSTALGDYVNYNIMPQLVGTPQLRAIAQVEDPFSYRKRPRMKIPKYMINGSGDQYFLPDNSRFYYSELPEEKRIRYVPNAKHDLAGTDVAESMIAWYQAIITGVRRPDYSWVKQPDGSLVVKSKTKPREVLMWQAVNPKARDFRVDTIGRTYVSRPLALQPNGTYLAQSAKPDAGFTAFFVELTYDVGLKYPLKFTTEVSVLPDVLPFKYENAMAQYPTHTPR